MFSILLTCCLILRLKAHSCDPDAWEGCLNEDIIASDTLKCSGLEGCENSTITVNPVTKSKTYLYCYGQNACEAAKVELAHEVRVWGTTSGLLMTTDNSSISKRILCNGFIACQKALLYSGTGLLGMGGGSLMFATAYASGSASSYKGRFYGFLTAMDATLDSNGVDTYKLDFFGFQSGANAQIYCRDGSDCTITCLNNSCSSDMTIYDVNAGSVALDCERTDECPTYVQVTSSKKLTKHQSETTFFTPDIENFLAYIDYTTIKNNLRRQLSKIDKYSTIVVGGRNECYKTDSCSKQVINDSSNDIEMQCDGYNSCRYNIITIGNAEFDCSGESSCSDSSFTADNGTLECIGYKSCENLRMSNVPSIGIYGWKTCVGCTFNGPGDITIFGSNAFNNAKININNGEEININSFGLLSFQDADISITSNSSLNANFYGYSAGYKSNIYIGSGSNATIICYDYACQGAKILYTDDNSLNLACLSSDSTYCPTVTQTSSSAWKAKISPKLKPNKPRNAGSNINVIKILTIAAAIIALFGLASFAVYTHDTKNLKETDYQPLPPRNLQINLKDTDNEYQAIP